ncbi:MAG: nitroreductase family protein [Dehalococcoidia bacterium]|nr:nitroreductase family protein [Dehalococcoidia bacterium]
MVEMRAMRRLKPDPVPADLIREVITYATHAPSGSNSQGWRFVVVTDPAKRAAIGEYYRQAVDNYLATMNTAPLPHQTRDEWERLCAAVRWQGDHVGEAPVLIFPCLKGARRGLEHATASRALAASVYPAVENLLLACRAKGLGATLTTLHFGHEAAIDELLGLPADAATFAMIPVGYPMGNFGPTRRLPVETVIGWDGWGE